MPAGIQVLNENPPQIDTLYLQRFESFRKFISPNNNEETTPPIPAAKVSSKTPQDNVWFYDMKADGFSLDYKRSEISDNDIPDIVYYVDTVG